MKLFLLALTISLASCSKSNDDNPSNNNNNSNNNNTNGQVTGSWEVIYYFDSGKDETGDYSGYSFNFASNGVLTAVNGSSTYTGAWRIGDSSSDDDSSSNKLVITITGNKAMDDLQDDWLIDSISDSEIRLRDDNPESAEELRFGR